MRSAASKTDRAAANSWQRFGSRPELTIRVSGRQDRSRPFRRRTPGRAPPLLPSERGVRLRQHDPAPNPIEQLRRVTRLKRGDCGARRRLGQIDRCRAPCVTCSSSATATKCEVAQGSRHRSWQSLGKIVRIYRLKQRKCFVGSIVWCDPIILCSRLYGLAEIQH